MWTDIARDISAATGDPFTVRTRREVSGGCINAGHAVSDGRRTYFVKTNAAPAHAMFAAEAAALTAIAGTRSVRVPCPICHGRNAAAAWLVLEHVNLHPLSQAAAGALGEQLAELHRCTAARYGWDRDNTIGSTPQANAWCSNWVEFWRERRLRPQYALALRNGYGGALQENGERLMERLQRFFPGNMPPASLLHGDLWSGNAACDMSDAPVVFDPASYYGDREADVAMTELFGGYPQGFYAAYQASYRLDPGYRERSTLYNLYHVLNHLNLFGGRYLEQAEAMTMRLLALA
ncbi:MAG: fructosamine kinase family protein [Rhodospirillaceae bacterium]